MPLIQVTLFEGRPDDVKKEYAKALTEASTKTLGCSPEAVDIIFNEVRKADWATAGKTWDQPQ